MSDLRTFLVSYPLRGSRYQLRIVADSYEDAGEHIKALAYAKVDGVLKLSIPIPFGGFFRWLFGGRT